MLSVVWLAASGPAGADTADPDARVEVGAEEIESARSSHAGMLRQFPPYEDAKLQGYVRAVGARVANVAPPTNVSFGFTVVDSAGAFAYSFAHGEIVISRGLLYQLNTEAQLAAVLAHEVGHVVSLHQAHIFAEFRKAQELQKRLSRHLASEQARDTLDALSLARVRGYGREQENQADLWSERLLARAGYDPSAMAQVLRLFIQQDKYAESVGFELWDLPSSGNYHGVFATHPSSEARLEQVTKRLGASVLGAPPSDAEYLKALQGVVYGLSERHGVLHGTKYRHPAWRIAFSVPERWYLFGTDDQLVAAPDTNEAIFIVRKYQKRTGTARDALRELAQRNPLKSTERLRSGPAVGESALIETTSDGVTRTIRLAVLDIGGQRLSFVGFTYDPASWVEGDKAFRNLLKTVRTLSVAEAKTVKPLRIHVEPVGTGGELPLPTAFAHDRKERWQLINQLYPDREAEAGQWVKTIR
jgi:predicted Zn-dependent protease